jgi:predicted nicotinamide N-methyase
LAIIARSRDNNDCLTIRGRVVLDLALGESFLSLRSVTEGAGEVALRDEEETAAVFSHEVSAKVTTSISGSPSRESGVQITNHFAKYEALERSELVQQTRAFSILK